jgi:hypothetical protein
VHHAAVSVRYFDHCRQRVKTVCIQFSFIKKVRYSCPAPRPEGLARGVQVQISSFLSSALDVRDQLNTPPPAHPPGRFTTTYLLTPWSRVAS